MAFKDIAPVHHTYSAGKDFSPTNSIVSANIYPAFTNVISGFSSENRMHKLIEVGGSKVLVHSLTAPYAHFTSALSLYPVLMASVARSMRRSSTDTVVVFVDVRLWTYLLRSLRSGK